MQLFKLYVVVVSLQVVLPQKTGTAQKTADRIDVYNEKWNITVLK